MPFYPGNFNDQDSLNRYADYLRNNLSTLSDQDFITVFRDIANQIADPTRAAYLEPDIAKLIVDLNAASGTPNMERLRSMATTFAGGFVQSGILGAYFFANQADQQRYNFTPSTIESTETRDDGSKRMRRI